MKHVIACLSCLNRYSKTTATYANLTSRGLNFNLSSQPRYVSIFAFHLNLTTLSQLYKVYNPRARRLYRFCEKSKELRVLDGLICGGLKMLLFCLVVSLIRCSNYYLHFSECIQFFLNIFISAIIISHNTITVTHIIRVSRVAVPCDHF